MSDIKHPVRIWFNHWFSTAYHLIGLMKQDDDLDCYVIGSGENRNSVVRLTCDEWHAEPAYMDDGQYVRCCLDFCQENGIDVFVPRRGMLAICARAREFEAAGTRLLLDTDYEKLRTLHDKVLTYDLFTAFAPECIPMMRAAGDFEAFTKAYDEISAQYDRVCFKLAADEGAASFRVIDNGMDEMKSLYTQPGLKLSYTSAAKLLEGYHFRTKLLVMPYLTGLEVSADCLATPSGNIVIPRYKLDGRMAEVRYDNVILSLCQAFFDNIRLKMPCNIQFKYHDGKLYLLEVNTRMSGGLQMSCLASGVNIPNIALNQVLGVDKPWTLEKKTCRTAHIEMPVILP